MKKMICVFVLMLGGCATTPSLSNFHMVSSNLYRGAQPTTAGFQELSKMGIKTVINLRDFHSDLLLIDTNKLRYFAIPMNAWNVNRKDAVTFLRIVMDTNNFPMFVHCKHGSDRTGTMCAIYRLAIDNWSKEKALDEMKNGGFGYHDIWYNLPLFISKLDVEALKSEVTEK